MRKIIILFCLVSVVSLCLPAQTLTVYPGDANNSKLCNHVDLLHIGLNYGNVGPIRNVFPNISWTAQTGPAWGGPVLLDQGYSDCDGNGMIERNDALAIEANFLDSVPGAVTSPDTNSIGSVSGPHLSINIVQDTVTIPVSGQVAIQLNVNLGSPNTPIDSLYGYAYTLNFDPVIVDQLTFAFAPNSFVIDSAGLTFFRIDTTLGKLFVSATNVDQMNRSGSGTIATIGIVMDDDIRISAIGSLILRPSFFLGYTSSAALVPVYPEGDTLTVITGRATPADEGLEIYPNPASEQVVVRSAEAMTAIRLRDMQGRTVIEQISPAPNYEIISIDQLPAGSYLLEIYARERILRRKLIIH
jgi:Secretion system C-terminal sorting domain